MNNPTLLLSSFNLTLAYRGNSGSGVWVDADVEYAARPNALYGAGAYGAEWYGGGPGALWLEAGESAAVTIAEPVSVACRFAENGGTYQFGYLEPLGTFGDDSTVSYAAGDLTISTTGSLVIGPFAAFDRALTASEQEQLERTGNWTYYTLMRNRLASFQVRPY